MPERDPNELLTSSQVSKLLRRSVSTITRMGKDGRLPVASEVGGIRPLRLYRRGDIEAFLADEDAKWGAA